ncbi:hypothetical protein HDA32_004084 [Spinactinospora alkalitolerans]|uniref:Uncharacterized protein n=1 Tax=Spinactinospora alkalitolerans TaxID=687207 RepID=A0A852U4E7_9ACTN|nr:hypothetical protein [Spinactinospora alkalitolerans]
MPVWTSVIESVPQALDSLERLFPEAQKHARRRGPCRSYRLRWCPRGLERETRSWKLQMRKERQMHAQPLTLLIIRPDSVWP